MGVQQRDLCCLHIERRKSFMFIISYSTTADERDVIKRWATYMQAFSWRSTTDPYPDNIVYDQMYRGPADTFAPM